MNEKIILIGLPGSGKTGIGKRLAQKLRCTFTDTDQRIVAQSGNSITDIFIKHGETLFRKWEHEVFAEAIGEPVSQVISTGGGVVMLPENRSLLSKQKYVIYLQVLPETLAKHTLNNSNRPLLQVSNPLETLIKLFEQRHPWYIQVSNFVVKQQYHSRQRTLNIICDWLKRVKCPIKSEQ